MAKIPVAGKKPTIYDYEVVAQTPTSTIIRGGGGTSEWRERVREIIFPVWFDGSQYIFDADGKMICQMRGWGGLTSSGLSDTEAWEVQKEFAEFIVTAMNTKPEPTEADISTLSDS